jgi:N-acylneuraminate cytidylyltransferase
MSVSETSYDDKQRLAIIPARSGSSRIKNKNIVSFHGKPLVSYPLAAARESNLFDTIHVSTDSAEYADIVGKLGFEVDFLRDDALGENSVGVADVIRWVVREYERRGKKFDEVCLIMATAALLEAEDIMQAQRLFEENGGRKPVLAVSSFSAPIERSLKVDEDGILRPVFPEKFHQHSQDLLTAYHDAGSLFYIGRDQLIGEEVYIYTEFVPLILPREKVVDIDELEDLAVAEVLYLGRKVRRATKDS